MNRMISRVRDAVLDISLHDTGGMKRIATEDALSALIVKPYTGAPDEVCPITLEELEPHKTLVSALSCGHVFCAEAIRRWLLSEKSECPICRSAIESREVSVAPQPENIDILGIATAYSRTPLQNLLSGPHFGPHFGSHFGSQFGPQFWPRSTQWLVNVICEDDDAIDIKIALYRVIRRSS